MADQLPAVELHLGPQGRLVIPASLRRAWRIETGEVLLARLENDQLILEKPAQIVRRVKERYAALRNQASMADELIEERRVEAQREDEL